MSNKSITIKGNMAYKDNTMVLDSKVIVGGLIFVMALVLLACLLGNANVAVNPLVPNRIF